MTILRRLLCFIACVCLSLSANSQPTAAPLGFASVSDSLRIPSNVRVGAEAATPHYIRQLIDALGVGSGLYGSCTPVMSKGDLAAVELVKIGAPAVELLAAVVKSVERSDTNADNAANRRWFAVQILGRIGDKRAEPALEYCLSHEPVPLVRASAPYSLEELRDPRAEDALMLGLKDPYPDIQASAALALGTLHSVRAIPALIALLGEPARMPAVNRGGMLGPTPVSPAANAARALGQIGTAAVLPLRAALASKDPQVHRFAALGLAGNRSPSADTDIRKLLRDMDPEVRLAAVRGESQRRDALAVPLLAERLGEASELVRQAAGFTLAATGGMPGLRALIAAANGRDAPAASAASEGLRDIWDPKAADLLLEVVRTGKGKARLSAAESLLHFSAPQAATQILNLLSDPEPTARAVAVWLINQLKDARAFPALVRATDDADERVRVAATELISHRTADPIGPPLLHKLTDPSEQVRLYAIYGLAKKDNRAAIAPLQRLLDHDTPRVQEAVRKALETIREQ